MQLNVRRDDICGFLFDVPVLSISKLQVFAQSPLAKFRRNGIAGMKNTIGGGRSVTAKIREGTELVATGPLKATLIFVLWSHFCYDVLAPGSFHCWCMRCYLLACGNCGRLHQRSSQHRSKSVCGRHLHQPTRQTNPLRQTSKPSNTSKHLRTNQCRLVLLSRRRRPCSQQIRPRQKRTEPRATHRVSRRSNRYSKSPHLLAKPQL